MGALLSHVPVGLLPSEGWPVDRLRQAGFTDPAGHLPGEDRGNEHSKREGQICAEVQDGLGFDGFGVLRDTLRCANCIGRDTRAYNS